MSKDRPRVNSNEPKQIHLYRENKKSERYHIVIVALIYIIVALVLTIICLLK